MQSAFDNLAHFMVQRFSASMMLTVPVALLGLIAFGINYSWLGGLIFALYLVPLSVFLTLLGKASARQTPTSEVSLIR